MSHAYLNYIPKPRESHKNININILFFLQFSYISSLQRKLQLPFYYYSHDSFTIACLTIRQQDPDLISLFSFHFSNFLSISNFPNYKNNFLT